MEKQYLEPLTWLRAIATFLVVVFHSIRMAEGKYASGDEASYFFPLALLDLGTFGVYLFFALSGCTLFISSHEKIRSFRDFLPFYIKRFMRIWPAFAVSLLIYILFIELFRYFYILDRNFWIAQFLKGYSLRDVAQYLSLTFNFTGPRRLFNGSYWTLPIEFQYYLLLPFALMLMKVKHLKYVSPLLFGGGLYYLCQEPIFEIDRNEIFKMGFVFFGGVLLATIYKKITYRISFKLSAFLFLSIVLFAGLIRTCVVTVPINIPFLHDKWNLYGILALISVAIAFITNTPTSQNKFLSRFLSFIHKYGEVSYSIYLFHMLFIGIAALLVMNIGIYGNITKLFFVLIFSLVGSFYFSIYTYRYIEKPSIEIGRRLSKPNKTI